MKTLTSVLTTTALDGAITSVISGIAINPKPNPAIAWTNEATNTAPATASTCAASTVVAQRARV